MSNLLRGPALRVCEATSDVERILKKTNEIEFNYYCSEAHKSYWLRNGSEAQLDEAKVHRNYTMPISRACRAAQTSKMLVIEQ